MLRCEFFRSLCTGWMARCGSRELSSNEPKGERKRHRGKSSRRADSESGLRFPPRETRHFRFFASRWCCWVSFCNGVMSFLAWNTVRGPDPQDKSDFVHGPFPTTSSLGAEIWNQNGAAKRPRLSSRSGPQVLRIRSSQIVNLRGTPLQIPSPGGRTPLSPSDSKHMQTQF
jgi:hypothetical protein